MTADDLNIPLRRDGQNRRPRIPIAVPRALAGGLGFCLAVFVLWAILANDPFGGEPIVVVTADLRTPNRPADEPSASPSVQPKPLPESGARATAEPDSTPPGGSTVTIIDGTSGKRQEMVIGSPDTPASDSRLAEMSRHGLIPRIGPDGVRPADAYARAIKTDGGKPAEGPRIAIVVGGLGIGASSTTEALNKLPGPVTLGFAPYGKDLNRWVGRARAEGHEVLLQLPMEPFDYPDNDPGPQTLLTSLGGDQNIDRLHWFMSRFQGYVGVANYMGARFTATEQAIAPVLRDVAHRGLIYFDDGTSPRSLASQIAGANNAAFAKADVVLDAVPTAAEIDGALGRLEAMARERGQAVGIATALPIVIDRLSQWAKAADSRGLVLVPVSAVANKPKPT